MFLKISCLWTGIWTLLTNKWLLTRMSSNMSLKILSYRKGIRTLLTSKWFLPRVVLICLFRFPAWEQESEHCLQANLQNEFSYVSSDLLLVKRDKNIGHKQMVSLQNEFSCVSLDFQLWDKNKNIVYFNFKFYSLYKMWVNLTFCCLDEVNHIISNRKKTFLKINCLQTNGFSSVWVLTWVFRLPDCEKDFEQVSQENGFSPEWIIIWVLRSLACEKDFEQVLHGNGFSP